MKKIILILTMLLSVSIFAQEDSDLLLLHRADSYVEAGGNLFDSGLRGLYDGDTPKLALKVSPAAPYTLDKTGAQIDIIHGGTFDDDLDITGTATNQLLLPISNDAVTPTIGFGTGGNTGFYENTDGAVTFSSNGVATTFFDGSGITGKFSGSFALNGGNTSSTSPSIRPDKGDDNTGVGQAAEDQLSLIAGGVEGIRITEATTITVDLKGTVAISLADINMTNIKVVKVTKAHGDDLFDASATTDNAVIWTQPVNSRLVGVIMRLETQFAGTGPMSDLRVTMGLTGDDNGLLTTTGNMTSDAEDSEYEDVGAYYDAFTEGVHGKTNATIAWKAYATSTGGDLDDSSAGTMDFYFIYETP